MIKYLITKSHLNCIWKKRINIQFSCRAYSIMAAIKFINLIRINKKIINYRLNNYKGSDNQKKFSLTIETYLNKEVASKDSKGNPKTYRINLESNISIKDLNGNVKNKSFSKSVDYNNRSNKSNLKKYENETSKNLAGKVADEIIIYLQSV